MDEDEEKEQELVTNSSDGSTATAQPQDRAGHPDAWRRRTPPAPFLPHTEELHNLHLTHSASHPLRRPGPSPATMQLGSTGVRPVLGRAANHLAHPPGLAQRAIHLPSVHLPLPRPRVPAPAVAPSTAQRVASGTRTLFTRLFAHLATPALRAQVIPVAGRSLHTSSFTASARAHGGITQNLSLPARHALRSGATHLPRAPTVPRPCSVTNVGLGTARNFHSGRPLFQNVIENAPILGRAMYEADVDVRKAKDQAKGKMRLVTKDKKIRRRGQMMKENQAPRRAQVFAVSEEEEMQEEVEYYFPSKPVAAVTTHVLVPLAPTPTSRMPLPSEPASSSRLLPLSQLGRLHASHSTHALRVSSLFARLDAAGVWTRGARSEAYGDPSGACTVLRIIFDGWDDRQVRQVLGEAGQGWCEIHEVREGFEDEEALSSGTVTPVSDGQLSEFGHGQGIDPAQSFVLPTLDFSSAFVKSQASSLANSRTSSTTSSPALSCTSSNLSTFTFERPSSRFDDVASLNDGYESDDSDSDGLSDCSFPSSSSSDSDDASIFGLSASIASVASRSSGASWVGVGFSSRFADRLDDEDRPREVMF